MIEAAMKLLHIRDPETGEFKPLLAIRGPQGIQGESDGRNAWIRFSAYADGTDYTPTWVDGQFYVGFASSITEPTDKSEYVWVNLLQVASVFVTPNTGDSDGLAISQKTFTESHDTHSEEIAAAEREITGIKQSIADINETVDYNNRNHNSSISSLNDKYSNHQSRFISIEGYINNRVAPAVDETLPTLEDRVNKLRNAVKRIMEIESYDSEAVFDALNW